MKDLIKEVALEGAEKFGVVADDSEIVDLVTWCLAKLSKRAKAVAWREVVGEYNGFIKYNFWQLHTIRPSSAEPLFTFPPIHDIEIIGLKELLEEVQKADDALSAGDKNEALIKVRTAWVAASIVKQHTRNRKLFKPLDIAEVENRVAEACAKLADAQQEMRVKFIEGMGGESRPFVPKDTAEAIRNQEWRKYK